MLNCKEFVNADEIAKGLSPFQPESISFQAGRIMLERINTLLESKSDFAFETTLATRSYKTLIEKASSLGYKISLLFFWLPSADLAIERVKDRVKKGGHNIPEDVIVRSYKAGLQNFNHISAAVVDEWILINNSSTSSKTIAEYSKGKTVHVLNNQIFEKFFLR